MSVRVTIILTSCFELRTSTHISREPNALYLSNATFIDDYGEDDDVSNQKEEEEDFFHKYMNSDTCVFHYCRLLLW